MAVAELIKKFEDIAKEITAPVVYDTTTMADDELEQNQLRHL